MMKLGVAGFRSQSLQEVAWTKLETGNSIFVPVLDFPYA
jgi:hypothetical protein